MHGLQRSKDGVFTQITDVLFSVILLICIGSNIKTYLEIHLKQELQIYG